MCHPVVVPPCNLIPSLFRLMRISHAHASQRIKSRRIHGRMRLKFERLLVLHIWRDMLGTLRHAPRETVVRKRKDTLHSRWRVSCVDAHGEVVQFVGFKNCKLTKPLCLELDVQTLNVNSRHIDCLSTRHILSMKCDLVVSGDVTLLERQDPLRDRLYMQGHRSEPKKQPRKTGNRMLIWLMGRKLFL